MKHLASVLKIAIVFLAAVWLWLVFGILSEAKAAPFTSELEADYAYAAEWWGAAPTYCSSVTREVVPQADLEGNSGKATMPRGDRVVGCRMRIVDDLDPCAARMVVLHEYGHLLGYGHSTDPASIMYPGASNYFCEREVFGQQVTELQAAVAHVQARCRLKVRRRPRRVCRGNEVWWRGALHAAEAQLDGVQEPQR